VKLVFTGLVQCEVGGWQEKKTFMREREREREP
jgi:hypothetical protein